MVKDTSTEKRILDAARRVFLKKGMNGARMQEIADEAGINKALLHYYFRNKQKLFDSILSEVIEQIGKGLGQVFVKDLSVTNRMLALVDVYMDVLLKNQYLPLFVLNEINHNPQQFTELIQKNIAVHIAEFMKQVEDEVGSGDIASIHPMHLLLNIMGMIIFPIAVSPVIKLIAGENMNAFIDTMYEERREVVKEFVINALRP